MSVSRFAACQLCLAHLTTSAAEPFCVEFFLGAHCLSAACAVVGSWFCGFFCCLRCCIFVEIRQEISVVDANHCWKTRQWYSESSPVCFVPLWKQWRILTLFSAILPGEPGLAGFIEANDDASGGDNWTLRRAKLHLNHHQQQTSTQCFTGWMPFLSPNQRCKSTEGKISHSKDLLTQSSSGVFYLCLLPIKAPGCIGEGCHACRQPSDTSTPV